MSVDYVLCYFCDDTVADCGMNSYSPLNYDTFSVCQYCSKRLIDEHYIEIIKEEPKWAYLINIDNKITYFPNWKLFEEYINNFDSHSEVNKISFGCWKEDPIDIDEHHINSLTKQNNNGGMSELEIKEYLESERKEGDINIDVGFRGFYKTRNMNNCYDKKIYKNYIAISFNNFKGTYLELIDEIDTFASENSLCNREYIMTHQGYHSKKHLKYFCFPLKNKHIKFFNTIEELKNSKYNIKELDDEELEHRLVVTEKFIKHRISIIEKSITNLTNDLNSNLNRLNSLNDYNKDGDKCEQENDISINNKDDDN